MLDTTQSEPRPQTSGTPGEAPHPHHISAGKVILVALILVAIVGAVGLAGYLPRMHREQAAKAAAREEKETLPMVTTARVKRAPKEVNLLLPGSVSPLAEASIYARAAGYVRKRHVDFGDRVREGQLLAEIDAPELDQQVAQARAALSQAKQQLAQARASLVQAVSQRDLAKITSDRYTALVARGAVARQDADTQRSNYESSEGLVEAQQATVGASEENIKQAQANLDRVLALQEYKSVRAPFAGVVTARNIDTGSLISTAGAAEGPSPGGSEMYRVAQIGTIRILTNVPQSSASGIEVGMSADVTVNELPGRTFAGKVTRTTNSLDPNSRTLTVEVQVPNRDGKLLPGMYAEVRFRFHRNAPPLLVPGDTLISTNSGMQVAVLTDAENRAKKIHMQPVTIGRDYGSESEITSGLNGDEMIIVNPGDDVREGALVKAEGPSK